MTRRRSYRPAAEKFVSAEDARRIAIHAQGLAVTADRPRTIAEVLARTGAVQLDTVSVLARSHELVAYARLGPVGRAAVEDAYWGTPARAFEYYAHANCILPIESWPYFGFRRKQMGGGHWARASASVIAEVRARLADGPVTASDLGGARSSPGWWNWSEAKHALEWLYYRGDAVCVTRRNWKRVYDLPERVLPRDVLPREPSPAECYAYLVNVTARARGIGTRRDIADYFQLLTRRLAPDLDRERLLDDAIDASGLVPVAVEGWSEPAFADPALMSAQAPREHRATLLSPFDSLIWAGPPPAGSPPREHTQRLFGYQYELELYKPKAARIHGYFTMPLLARGGIAGHVDPAREGRTLVARNVALHDAAALDDMAAALREAAAWVGCGAVRLERVQPRAITSALRRLVG
jgi:hypothetical protein